MQTVGSGNVPKYVRLGVLSCTLVLMGCGSPESGDSTPGEDSDSSDDTAASEGSSSSQGSSASEGESDSTGTSEGSDGTTASGNSSDCTETATSTSGSSDGTETATSNSGGTGESTGGMSGDFEPCTIDVSKVGPTCSGSDPSSCDGADIAMNFALWPDPYECYVCAPGVTLLKGSACETQGVELVWNATKEQCILNGQGYPIENAHACSSSHYADGVSPGDFKALLESWYTIAVDKGEKVFQPNAGADAYIVDLTLEGGEKIKAAMSMGHGVLDGKCGATFLIKHGDRYVLVLQTDIRAWSLELSPGANTWLDPSNVGGTCIIPEVRKIDASFVVDQFL